MQLIYLNRFGERKPIFVGELLGTGSGFNKTLERASKLLSAMLERAFRKPLELSTDIIADIIVAVMADKLHHRGADLRARPETARRHLADDLHVIVELHTHTSKTTRLRALLCGQTLSDLGLDENDNRFRSLESADAVDQLYKDAGSGLIRQV